MKKPIILAVILLLLDQITKFAADKLISYGGSVSVIPFFNFFNITNVRNTGAAFSTFQGQNLILSAVIFLFLAVVSAWLVKNKDKLSVLQKYAFCLIISGGIGNLIDRILRGAVVDFLDFGINSLRWPSFNVADSSVCVAAALIVIDVFILPALKKQKA